MSLARTFFVSIMMTVIGGNVVNSQESKVYWTIALRASNAPKLSTGKYRIAMHKSDQTPLVESKPVTSKPSPRQPSKPAPRVPNIVGLTIEQAYDKLKSHGFELQYNPKLSSKTEVSRQSPLPNASLSPGGRVAAECFVRVPDLKGLTIEQANAKLKASHIDGEIVGQYLRTDRILAQSKKPGSQVYALSKIKLTTAAQVPNLVGMNASTANQALKAALLDANARTKVVPTTMAAMHGQTQIVSQGFAAGSFVSRARKMNVDIVKYQYQAPNNTGNGINGGTPGHCPYPSGPQGGGKIRFGGNTGGMGGMGGGGMGGRIGGYGG